MRRKPPIYDVKGERVRKGQFLYCFGGNICIGDTIQIGDKNEHIYLIEVNKKVPHKYYKIITSHGHVRIKDDKRGIHLKLKKAKENEKTN